MSFDYDKVKNILVCPASKSALVHDDTALVSVDPETRASYPILDDIPRLLAVEATQLTPEDWGQVMQRHGRDARTGQTL